MIQTSSVGVEQVKVTPQLASVETTDTSNGYAHPKPLPRSTAPEFAVQLPPLVGTFDGMSISRESWTRATALFPVIAVPGVHAVLTVEPLLTPVVT